MTTNPWRDAVAVHVVHLLFRNFPRDGREGGRTDLRRRPHISTS
jgi:hypothetical protein